jgi:XTP/dITP diphosphohydrolase
MRPRPVLVVATLNVSKGRELFRLLAGVPYDLQALADMPGASLPDEGTTSFRDNALAKARAAAQFTRQLALADDSGLEVDALDGAPGVLSARFGGPGLDDAGRVRHLLQQLAGVEPPRRTARFRCVIALVQPGGPEHLVEGVVDGVIAGAPRGTSGFGYDPVFFYAPLARTFGQLTAAEKGRVSHRGRAVVEARRLLSEQSR